MPHWLYHRCAYTSDSYVLGVESDTWALALICLPIAAVLALSLLEVSL